MLNRKLIYLCILCIILPALAACGQKKVTEETGAGEDFEYLYHAALNGDALDKDGKKSVQKEYKVEKGEFRKSISEIGEIVYEDLYYEEMETDNADNVKFLVEVGDKVKKGDVLATYEAVYDNIEIVERTRDVESMENQYRAEYESQKAEINMAEHELKEIKDKKEREIKELQIKKLKLTLEKFAETEDSIILEREELNDTIRRNGMNSIIATHSGYVVEKNEKEEGFVKGDCMVTISGKEKYHIAIPVRDEVSGMKYGSDVTVIVEGMNGAADVTMQGKVMAASNILNPRKYSAETVVRLTDEPEGVDWNNPIKVRYDGIYVEDALLVPVDAVMTEKTGGGKYVEDVEYVYIKNNDLIYKSYLNVVDSNSKYYRVCGGVAEGDTLVCFK
ncbi:MAG: hypothetical protein HFH14_05915 [Lachnospiraceae bacterium]|nr:hypothetical protein [Lachnospiraceae bacterium]